MCVSAIPRAMSKHPGPQPEISHYDWLCRGEVHADESLAPIGWGPAMGALRAQVIQGAQEVCLDLFAQKTGHSRGPCLLYAR